MNGAHLLEKIKTQMGLSSVKALYLDFQSRGLSCNYPSFAKFYNGDLLPSPALITELCQACPKNWSDSLLLAFCQDLFPRQNYLFSQSENLKATTPLRSSKRSEAQKTSTSGKLLSRRQVACLAQSPVHYLLFTILTLARRPLTLAELEVKTKRDTLLEVLADLRAAGFLLGRETGEYQLIATEWKFPLAEQDNLLIKTYRQFDDWDNSLAEKFDFQINIRRLLVRRVSPRYLHLIQRQLEIALDSTKLSDELETKHNSSIVHLRIELKSGSLPG